MDLKQKYENLKRLITSYGKVAVAFSSGVDSTLLLHVAHEVLGDQVMAITAVHGSFPLRETQEAQAFCEDRHIHQLMIESNQYEIPGFCDNPPDRCYVCKKALFSKMLDVAHAEGFDIILEGSNKSDESDYRPGLVAIRELGIKSPLRACGLTKDEIRRLSERLHLPTSHKPSFACLATRFGYGETITPEKLLMVEKAEDYLLKQGFTQVRVRMHDQLARIELPAADIDRMLDVKLRIQVDDYLKSLGFLYVALDLRGYRTGSMNETLSDEEKKLDYKVDLWNTER